MAKKYSLQTKHKIAKLFETDTPTIEITNKFGIPKRTVEDWRRYWKEETLFIRPTRNRYTDSKNSTSDAQIASMKKLFKVQHENGMPLMLTEIAKKVGVRPSTVWYWKNKLLKRQTALTNAEIEADDKLLGKKPKPSPQISDAIAFLRAAKEEMLKVQQKKLTKGELFTLLALTTLEGD